MLIEKYMLGDGIKSLETESYDYVLSSIPCYENLGSFGVDKNHPETYKDFVDLLVKKMSPKLGTVTIAFTGCRRANSRILPKFFYVNQSFFEHGYYLRDTKFYQKKSGYDAYSHTIGHVYTFQKEGVQGIYNLRKESLYHTYGKDLWGPFSKERVVAGEVVGMPRDIPQMCIENFTEKGHVVCDPFGGLGTTGLAAKSLGRGYVVTEIVEDIYREGMKLFQEAEGDLLNLFEVSK